MRYIEYDLERLLEPQFAVVKRHLVAQQQILVNKKLIDGQRAHSKAQPGRRYLKYLRTLDALEDRAKVAEIAEGLFPEEADTSSRDRKIRAMIAEAKRLRDSGFRLLPALTAAVGKRKNNARR